MNQWHIGSASGEMYAGHSLLAFPTSCQVHIHSSWLCYEPEKLASVGCFLQTLLPLVFGWFTKRLKRKRRQMFQDLFIYSSMTWSLPLGPAVTVFCGIDYVDAEWQQLLYIALFPGCPFSWSFCNIILLLQPWLPIVVNSWAPHHVVLIFQGLTMLVISSLNDYYYLVYPF